MIKDDPSVDIYFSLSLNVSQAGNTFKNIYFRMKERKGKYSMADDIRLCFASLFTGMKRRWMPRVINVSLSLSLSLSTRMECHRNAHGFSFAAG